MSRSTANPGDAVKDSDFDTPVNIGLREAAKWLETATPEEFVAMLVRTKAIEPDFAPEAIRRLHAAEAKEKAGAAEPAKKPRKPTKKAKA